MISTLHSQYMFDVKVRKLFVEYFNGRYLTFHKIWEVLVLYAIT